MPRKRIVPIPGSGWVVVTPPLPPDTTIDAVEEPDPTKPRPGEPGWSPFDPWEDPAFEWFREENRKAKDDEEMIAIPLADAVRIRDFMEDIQNRVGLGYELESLPPDEEAVLERLKQALAGKAQDGD